MKKLFFITLSLLLCGALFTGMTRNKLVSVKGYIEYYGNVPFAEPGFKADDNSIYALSVAPEATFTLQDILNMQGHYLQLDGTIEKADLAVKPANAQGTIIIHAYKDISKTAK